MSGFSDINEVQDPDNVIIVTRYELTAGMRLSSSGITPYVGLTLVGMRMTEGGEALVETREERHHVLDRDNAIELAHDILEAARQVAS